MPLLRDAGSGTPLLNRLRATTPSERLQLLTQKVQQEVAAILGFSESTAVSPQIGFFELGMDSLMALELKNRLEKDLGLLLSPRWLSTGRVPKN